MVVAGDVDLGAEGNHRDGNQRHEHREERRQQVEELVDVRRHHVFLGDQLDDVGKRLQQAVRTHAIRAHAHLHVRDHFALHPLQIRQHVHQDGDHDRDLDQRDDVVIIEQVAHCG